MSNETERDKAHMLYAYIYLFAYKGLLQKIYYVRLVAFSHFSDGSVQVSNDIYTEYFLTVCYQ